MIGAKTPKLLNFEWENDKYMVIPNKALRIFNFIRIELNGIWRLNLFLFLSIII